MNPLEEVLLAVAVLLLAGIAASKASHRLGIPALLLFLLIGMLAGSEGIGKIPFDDTALTQAVGIIALSFILFAGGLETNWRQVKGVVWRGLSLSTIGVLFTAMLAGAASIWLLGFSLLEGMLLGAIMSSTDAAAVFSVLRSRGASLKGTTRPLLELESGSNDPMAVFLTMALIRLIKQPNSSIVDLLGMFLLQFLIGGAVGYGLGRASILVVNRIKLETEGLYPVLTLSLALLTYSLTSFLQGNGFLAVYVAGIVMGKSEFIHKRSLIRFHDGLAWLMQIAMFVVLGLLVYPSRLVPVAGAGCLIAVILMFVARPIGVFISLLFARLGVRHKLLISWVGLRGAVPIVLATFPAVAGVANSNQYFDIVFFVVLASVLFQGTTLTLVADWLKLRAPLTKKFDNPLEYVSRGISRNDLVDIPIPENSPVAGKQIVDMNLPKSALVVLVGRNDDFIVPRGNTVLEPGDLMLILGENSAVQAVRALVGLPDEEMALDALQD